MGNWDYLPARHIRATVSSKGHLRYLWQKWEAGVTPEWQA